MFITILLLMFIKSYRECENYSYNLIVIRRL